MTVVVASWIYINDITCKDTLLAFLKLVNTDLIYVISPANIQRIGRITIVLNQKSSTDADEDAATARDGVSYGAGGAATARHAHETAEHDHECESELYQYAYVDTCKITWEITL